MRTPVTFTLTFLFASLYGQQDKIYNREEGVFKPRVLYKTDPEYSEEARRANVAANVMLQLVVTPQGKAVDFKVLQSAGFGLDEQSIESVKAWRFLPGRKDGKPVNVQVNVQVNFRHFEIHNNNASSLIFDLAAGVTRPVLMQGTIPSLPVYSAGQRFAVNLTVSSTGVVETVDQVSDSGPWTKEVVDKIKLWQFTPGMKDATPVSVKGTYTLVPNEVESSPPAPPEAPMAILSKLEPPVLTPKLVSPLDNATFATIPRLTVCKWKPYLGAVSYILEWDYLNNAVWQSETSNRYMEVLANGTEASFDFIGAQPGRWRVRPVNAQGKRGNPSEWRGFAYTR